MSAQRSPGEARRAVTYTSTIYAADDPDSMPLWESIGHNDADDARQAATGHIERTRPEDRMVPRGHGEYTVWATGDRERSTHVATVVISPSDVLNP